MERFIGELVVASNRAAEAVLALESMGVSRAFAAATRRELAEALDPSPEAFAAAELRWQRRWTGLRRWFIDDGAPSQAELLRARARSAIPALLTAVTQINDRRSQRADRAADFSTLARWFAQAPDDDSAHRLWRVAFALAPARHVRINAETLDARAQKNESPRTSWLEATPMWLSPRLRTTGRAATRGAALATIDRSAEKPHLTLLANQQAAQLRRASDQLLLGGRRSLAELGPLDSFEFRLFHIIRGNLVQCLFEKFELHVEIHSVRSVQTDQSCVNRHVGVLSFRSRMGCGSAEVNGVSSHEGPVAIENEGLELPSSLRSVDHANDTEAVYRR